MIIGDDEIGCLHWLLQSSVPQADEKIGKEVQLVADQAAIGDCLLTGAVLQGNLPPVVARQLITGANQLMLQRKKPLTGLISP
ncbi:hypothetical protein [Bradyrhizobium sp. USDA 223]|uniref:hypothetical protein n=1 Tax=Bradyrhizobium sp. USDA 223 TaxID=3156306 RepID=UPI003836AB71